VREGEECRFELECWVYERDERHYKHRSGQEGEVGVQVRDGCLDESMGHLGGGRREIPE
jgi:hypothetical protein